MTNDINGAYMRLISQSEFRKIIKISPSTLYEVMKGKKFKNCVQEKKINIDSKEFYSYLSKKKKKNDGSIDFEVLEKYFPQDHNFDLFNPEKEKKQTKQKNIYETPQEPEQINLINPQEQYKKYLEKQIQKSNLGQSSGFPDSTDAIDDIMNMSIYEIVKLYGSIDGFQAFLAATSKHQDIKAKMIKTGIEESRLVSKELMKKKYIDPVNNCLLKLMRDLPKTLTTRITPMVEDKEPHEAIENSIYNEISKTLRPAFQSLQSDD